MTAACHGARGLFRAAPDPGGPILGFLGLHARRGDRPLDLVRPAGYPHSLDMFGELPDPLLAVTTVQQLRPVTQSPYRHTIKTIPLSCLAVGLGFATRNRAGQ